MKPPPVPSSNVRSTTEATTASLQARQQALAELELREQGLIADIETLAKVGLATDRLPKSILETQIAEQVLSDELAKLSMEEHEKVMFDIHGFQSDLDDPSDIEQVLEDLDTEIRRVPHRQAYERAKYFNEDYVMDPSVRLKFLRGDMFNTRLAAQRMIYYFQTKQSIFGEGEILGREVLLADLSEEDTEVLKSGFVQLLPTCDLAGRMVMVISHVLLPFHATVDSCCRALWYFFNLLLNNLEAQRRGVVNVLFNTGMQTREDDMDHLQGSLDKLQGILRVRWGMPKRITAVHYCFEHEAFKPFATAVQLALDVESRKRFRLHQGNYETIAFELQTYGIPMDDFPIRADGSANLEKHTEWLQARKTLEAQQDADRGHSIIAPRRFDVLFGRSREFREHTGNARAKHLVAMYMSAYEQANKTEKTTIAESIVQIILDSQGRFLKWVEGGWEPVDMETARAKIAHSFRHLRSKHLEGDKANSTSAAELSSTSDTKETERHIKKRETPSPTLVHMDSVDNTKNVKPRNDDESSTES
eukprot:Nitzschia sp. Nitz4//scaffold44_size153857//52335//54016//NITZ4_002713-RA/size153857-augustus-gene-0.4-mRNA-1//1//CDS//3329552133//6726//frame0